MFWQRLKEQFAIVIDVLLHPNRPCRPSEPRQVPGQGPAFLEPAAEPGKERLVRYRRRELPPDYSPPPDPPPPIPKTGIDLSDEIRTRLSDGRRLND